MFLGFKFFFILSFMSSLILSLKVYHKFDRFWTSVGFCPAGGINHKEIALNLLSDSVTMNMHHIASLPNGAITHVRIHWLLELIEFNKYNQNGDPIYDFTLLDKFIDFLDDLDLAPIVEIMANPGNIFQENENRNDFLWENFVTQIVKRYQGRLGVEKILNWYFESWNEPDLPNYNRLNFTFDAYLQYMKALNIGLAKVSNFSLIGPAGIFKAVNKHRLCWSLLDYCNSNLKMCPIKTLSFHRKGYGNSEDVLYNTLTLLNQIYKQFPNLKDMPLINSEADPIAIWSQPREFQADVRYAVILLKIVFEHWNAKLNRTELKNLQLLSHDNAFISFHPNEFSQRTLLAHFRINNTQPPHSQFVQKPVYAALGILSKLGTHATKLVTLAKTLNYTMQIIKTKTIIDSGAFYRAVIVMSSLSPSLLQQRQKNFTTFYIERKYKMKLKFDKSWAYIIELLEPKRTDPVHVWMLAQHPAYPNATLRDAMRRSQSPRLYRYGKEHTERQFHLNCIRKLSVPWVILLRVCSIDWPKLKVPLHCKIIKVTRGEVFISWRDDKDSTQCLKTYEVWYRASINLNWKLISETWHLPYPSFQFAPTDGYVSGFYKVRGIDLFDKPGPFSGVLEYYEV